MTAGYSPALRKVCTGFDPHSVIRGLAADRETGALVKLNYSSSVVKARRGHTWLSDQEVRGTESCTTRSSREPPSLIWQVEDLFPNLAGGGPLS
jgi:hypothetical protein